MLGISSKLQYNGWDEHVVAFETMPLDMLYMYSLYILDIVFSIFLIWCQTSCLLAPSNIWCKGILISICFRMKKKKKKKIGNSTFQQSAVLKTTIQFEFIIYKFHRFEFFIFKEGSLNIYLNKKNEKAKQRSSFLFIKFNIFLYRTLNFLEVELFVYYKNWKTFQIINKKYSLQFRWKACAEMMRNASSPVVPDQ